MCEFLDVDEFRISTWASMDYVKVPVWFRDHFQNRYGFWITIMILGDMGSV